MCNRVFVAFYYSVRWHHGTTAPVWQDSGYRGMPSVANALYVKRRRVLQNLEQRRQNEGLGDQSQATTQARSHQY